MKKYLISLLLLFSVQAWATTMTASVSATNENGTYLVLGGTPAFYTNTTPFTGNGVLISGHASAATGANAQTCFRFNFSGTPIPSGATITSAKLTVWGRGIGFPTSGAKNRIRAEKTTNAAVFINGNVGAYTTRYANVTTAYVNWDNQNFTSTWYDTPDLTTVVAEVAALGELSALAFYFDDEEVRGTDNNLYGFSGYDTLAENAAQLTVTYTGGAPAATKVVPWRLP